MKRSVIDMKDAIDRMRAGIVIISLCFIVLGIALIMWPNTSLQLIVYFLGAIILCYGVAKIINYNVQNGEFKNGFDLIVGIVFSVLGLLMVFFSDSVIELLTYIFGFYICVDGAINIQKSFDLKKFESGLWKFCLVLGSVTLVVGILFLCKPFDAANTLVIMMGIMFIYDGVVNLIMVMALKHARKKFEKSVAENVIDADVTENYIEDDSSDEDK